MAADSKVVAFFGQLEKSLTSRKEELIKRVKGLIVFKVDGSTWTLDLRAGKGELYEGPPPEDKPDLTLAMSADNFVKLITGKLNPQQAFLMRKMKLSGSMGMAMKLQPIIDAARPVSKL